MNANPNGTRAVSRMKGLLSLPCLLIAVAFAHAQTAPLTADLIVVNASVHTMDADHPMAEAVAVRANRIVAVGTTAEVRALSDKRTRVIDAGGRLVVPGFNDSHVHFINSGFRLSGVDLRSADTPAEFGDRIRAFAEKLPKGRWIVGGDWDHERWAGAPLPTRELIDSYTPDTPVFVRRLDGHMGLANSYALKLGGVTKDTPDPPGGLIVRDARGEPTGVLKDAAMVFVTRKIPPSSFSELMEGARAATDHAAKLGVTSVQDMSAGDDVGVYQELLKRGELKTRIYAVSSLPRYDRLAATGIRAPFGSDMIRIGGLKGFADGSLGSTTAYFFEPYNDAPNTRGLASDEMARDGVMIERVRKADKAGLQVMIHAIGDRANDQILGIYEQVAKENGERDRRFRIEHAQHLRLADIARFRSGHVIASMQPYHCADDGRWAEKRIGPERAKGTYAFRTLIDSGVVLAFGSDWSVAPLDPIQGIAAAVTRRTLDGRHPGGWVPEQKITVEEAVRAYTFGSAYAEFQDKIKGTISVGKLADLVVLSHNLFAINPLEIEKANVVLTLMDGRIVHDRLP